MRIFFLLILVFLLNSCLLTGETSSLRESHKYACLAPSMNYRSLDAKHSTKIHLVAWAKKYAVQAVSPEFKIEDKCSHTKILINALYTQNDGSILNWANDKNKTSGKIKILRTIYDTGGNSVTISGGFRGCREYSSRLIKNGEVTDYKFLACPSALGWGVFDDSSGFPIPPHLVFAGWYFYDYRFFK